MKKKKGKKILNPEEVESFVSAYYGRPLEAIHSSSLFKRDRLFKGALFVMMKEFCGMLVMEVAKRYFLSGNTVSHVVVEAREKHREQLQLLREELNTLAEVLCD